MENQHRKITGYRELSEAEVALMNKLKEHGNEIGFILDQMALDKSLDQRCVAIAKTQIQTGMMFAIRAVAQPTTFC